MTSPDHPTPPPREPYAVRHARHMRERAAAEEARRQRHRPLAPPGPPQSAVPLPPPIGQPVPGPLPAARPTTSHAGTCLIFGILAVLAGAIGPRIPGYLTGQGGRQWSVAGYHAACTSGLGELAQAGHGQVASACSRASLLLTVGWVVAGAGALLLLAAVLLWTRQPRTEEQR